MPVYLIILMALQIFQVTVSVEAFLTDEEGLAWATATVSVVLAGSGALFLRYLRPNPERPSGLATLFPGNFAVVMATGIIAVGAAQQDLQVMADVLWAMAVAALVVLVALHLLRIARHSGRFAAELTSHSTAFAYLTAVAAVNVVGSGAAVIHGWWTAAWVCWIAGGSRSPTSTVWTWCPGSSSP